MQKKSRWHGMGDTLVKVVKACLSCAQVKARFKELGKELQPFPIRRLRYRWVIVCIEHFTKHVELIPLPSKSSQNSARGFLEGVHSRYKKYMGGVDRSGPGVDGGV